jgi:DICT domain-containing protein
MKMIAEYLEHALNFERLAAQENNPEIRAQFETQAAAYRKLVAERAAKYGLPAPSSPLLRAPQVSLNQPNPDH